MGYVTIENNGTPWVICRPTDKDDLQKFLDLSQDAAGPIGFLTRAANADEVRKCSAALMLHVRDGGNVDSFFGIPA